MVFGRAGYGVLALPHSCAKCTRALWGEVNGRVGPPAVSLDLRGLIPHLVKLTESVTSLQRRRGRHDPFYCELDRANLSLHTLHCSLEFESTHVDGPSPHTKEPVHCH